MINRQELVDSVVDLLFRLDEIDSHKYRKFLVDEGVTFFDEIDTLSDKRLISLGEKLHNLLEGRNR